MDKTIDRFLGRLRDYVKHKDRGTLADLRHGFSKATEHRAWPHLAAAGCDLERDRDRLIWQTVAAGFATFATLEGTSPKAGNMGTTLHAIATDGRTDKKEALKSFDGRFCRLLTCHTAEEVCERLPGILRTAKQKGIGVDFRQLWEDLNYWGERTKVRWASAYWGAKAQEGEAAP